MVSRMPMEIPCRRIDQSSMTVKGGRPLATTRRTLRCSGGWPPLQVLHADEVLFVIHTYTLGTCFVRLFKNVQKLLAIMQHTVQLDLPFQCGRTVSSILHPLPSCKYVL